MDLWLHFRWICTDLIFDMEMVYRKVCFIHFEEDFEALTPVDF